MAGLSDVNDKKWLGTSQATMLEDSPGCNITLQDLGMKT